MSVVKLSRKYHKWLMLFLGVQFLIWSISGAYMVIFDIDYIHGDSLVLNHQTKIDIDKIAFSQAELFSRYPKASNIEVAVWLNKPIYRFNVNDEKYLLDASGGKQLSPLDKSTAIEVAKYYYSGKGRVISTQLITENPPFELSQRVLPAWRVDFLDFGSPALYISSQTGKVVTKRHTFWRLFDWMFSFHVMDYQEEDVSNKLLFWFVIFSLFSVGFGMILTFYRVFKTNSELENNGVS